MKPGRIKIFFADNTDPESRDAFAIVFEMFGAVYGNQKPRSLTILPDKARAVVLTEQLRELEQEGTLTWTSFAT
jgi:DNA-binding HxlR family transcriptional regulator